MSLPRDTDRAHLHPALLAKLDDLEARLKAAELPMALYEGARSPFRQAELYARGRTEGDVGRTVTRARAWWSFHQYGLAADYVFRDARGNWTWEAPHARAWEAFTEQAEAAGLRCLSFERPHVELPVMMSAVQAGRFPAGESESWRAWLAWQIAEWGPSQRAEHGIVHPAAPVAP